MTDQASPERSGSEPLRLEVEMNKLGSVGTRPTLFAYIAALWSYRHFIRFDAQSRLRSSYRKNLLGPAWLVLTPVLNGLTYYLIFGILIGTSRGIDNFLGYLIIGVFGFQFTSKVVTSAASSIQGNRKVVSAFNFPKASLPIAAALRETFGYLPGFFAMLVLVLVLHSPDSDPAQVTWRWLLVIPIFLIQAIFSQGIGLLLSRMISSVPDFQNILSFIMRIWMYSSAVFYTFDRFSNNPELVAVLELNPLYQILTMLRDVLLYAQTPSWEHWGTLIAWAVGAYVIGFIVFWTAEETYAREAK
ncbi:hypothetical protein BJH93_09150 [Kocuria polaris]|nr:hypothetical protein [Kocuria polaris]